MPPLVIHGAAQLLVATMPTPLGYLVVSQLRCLGYYFWVPVLFLGPFNLPYMHFYEGYAWAVLSVVSRPPLQRDHSLYGGYTKRTAAESHT